MQWPWQDILDKLDTLERKLDRITLFVARVIKLQNVEAPKVSELDDRVAELVSRVGPMTNAVNGMEATLASVNQMLKDALANTTGNPQALAQQIAAVSATLDQKTQEMVAAVTQNTPASQAAPPINQPNSPPPSAATGNPTPEAANPVDNAGKPIPPSANKSGNR